MDKCIVCLTANSNILSGINSKSSEWQKCNIQRIIEKHLWWWYLKQSSPLQWICWTCWRELLSFHTFFTRVEKAHRQYDLLNVEKVSTLVATDEFQKFDDMLLSATSKQRRKENTLQVPPAKTVQHDKLQNLRPEPLKMQDYDNLQFIINDDKSQKIPNDSDEEIERGSVDLTLVKEEFQVLECSLTALRKDKIKFQEVSFNKNIVAPSANIDENEIENKSTKAEVNKTNKSINRSPSDIDYIDKSGFQFVCHLCKMPSSNFRKLKSHYRSEHSTVGYAVCCNKKFYNPGILADHLRVHEDPNYFKCPSCDKIMSNRLSLETHMVYHKLPNSDLNPVFNCDKCDKFFLTKASYNRHNFMHVPEEERKFQCEECKKKFGSEHLANLHKTFAHQKKYCKICEICGKSFRERFSFKRHMDEHNGQPSMKVPCDICGVELTNKYLLNRHKKFMHTEENLQAQICPHCSKVSPNMAAHRQHIFYNHTMERKHACNICDKKFKLALKLKEHLSTHTGEPLFTCPFCSQTFISKSRMYKHRKDAHPKEWQEVKQKKNIHSKS